MKYVVFAAYPLCLQVDMKVEGNFLLYGTLFDDFLPFLSNDVINFTINLQFSLYLKWNLPQLSCQSPEATERLQKQQISLFKENPPLSPEPKTDFFVVLPRLAQWRHWYVTKIFIFRNFMITCIQIVNKFYSATVFQQVFQNGKTGSKLH